MAIDDTTLKKLGDVTILPRSKAEFEFDKRFERTRPNQRIARVTTTRYFKSYSGVWMEIKEKDMTDI